MINIDWSYLRRSMIIFGVTIMTFVVLTIVGWEYEKAQEKDYRKALSTLESTHNRYRKLVNDIALIEKYRSIYRGYKTSGLIGKEHRLSWVESLESTNQVLRLPRLAYNLEPQEEFNRPGFVAKSGVAVRSSTMGLTLGLLHEEDLFALLEDLRLSIKNLFTVESCSLFRQGSLEDSLHTKASNLQARCKIRWVTIDAK